MLVCANENDTKRNSNINTPYENCRNYYANAKSEHPIIDVLKNSFKASFHFHYKYNESQLKSVFPDTIGCNQNKNF